MKDAKVKIEKLNNPIQFATTEDGAPCYADACYVCGTEMIGYRECKTPRRRVMGYPKRFWRHLFDLFWWRHWRQKIRHWRNSAALMRGEGEYQE